MLPRKWIRKAEIILRKSGKKIVKSPTRTQDNKLSSSNIDANLKLSSDDGDYTMQLLDPVILCDSDLV